MFGFCITRKSANVGGDYFATAVRNVKAYKSQIKSAKTLRSVSLGALTITVLQGGQYAVAQESPGTVDQRIEDEIIVTAERFNRSAQDIAASLTVFDKVSLEKADVKSLQELDRYIPNVLLTNQGSPRFSINSVRGISSAVRADYFSQTIGIYIDGVPVTAAEYSRALGDVQQIEVLRGPQGTLYGRNTPGGIINIITRPPQDEFQGEIGGRIGNNGQHGASALMSGPIVEGLLSGKVFFDYIAHDGFTDYASLEEKIDDLRSITGSVALRFTPGENTDITFSASIEDINQGAYAFQAFDDFKDRRINITPPNREDRIIKAMTLNVRHDFDNVTLQSITGLRYYDVKSNQDMGYNPLIVVYGGGKSESIEEGDQFSQEIRLSGLTENGGFRWLVGGFYSTDTVEYDYFFDVPAFGSASLSTSVYDREELAGFGEATATLLDRLDLTVGVRVSKDTHKLVNNAGADDSISFTIVTPKFRAAYRIDDDYQIYALASRGSRTGGFNRFSAGDNYKPEYLWNYELGLKSRWLDNTLTINAAMFYIDWKDQQVRTLIGPSTAKIVNAGDAHNFGGELELSWQVSSAFNVSGFIGFNDGEYDVFIDKIGADLSGNSLVNTPDVSAGIAAEYSFPVFNSSMTGWIRPEFTYTGDHFFDAENRLLQQAYGLVNLNFGIENERISILVFVKNIFDKDYRSYGYTDSISNYDLAVAGEFRTFGLNLKAKF